MRKAIAIFLLVIFLFNTTGYFLIFKIAQFEIKKEIKKEIKSHLHPEELTIIRVLNSNINSILWVEKNKEFIFHDQMFDIVKTLVNSKETTFYCINDKQEKKLFKNLEEQVLKQIEHNKKSKNGTSKKNGDNIEKNYFFEDYSLTVLHKTNSHFYEFNKESYTSIDILISTPPPRNLNN